MPLHGEMESKKDWLHCPSVHSVYSKNVNVDTNLIVKNIENTLCNGLCDKTAGLKCMYTNSDTLTNKMEELEVFVNKHNIDIIAICETLPKNSLDDKNDYVFNLPDYKPINKSEGRGVCLFVKNNIDCVQLSEPEQIFKPSIFCKILTNNNDFLIFGLVYRSEDKCTDTENENLNKQIDFVMQKYSKNKVIIVGDFNYPDIEWEHDHCNKSPEHKSSKFLETINDNVLTQCVT